jgi:hypothetical protein
MRKDPTLNDPATVEAAAVAATVEAAAALEVIVPDVVPVAEIVGAV